MCGISTEKCTVPLREGITFILLWFVMAVLRGNADTQMIFQSFFIREKSHYLVVSTY